MNHGLSTYNVHANYRLDDENPVRIEVYIIIPNFYPE